MLKKYCIKRHLEQFFAQEDKKTWEDGIMKLPVKQQKVVEQNGEYTCADGFLNAAPMEHPNGQVLLQLRQVWL